MKTVGYVGTVEVETRNVSRLWFSLTEDSQKDSWIKLGGVRAWFTINLEAGDRPFYFAQLTLPMEALRSGLHGELRQAGAERLARGGRRADSALAAALLTADRGRHG